MQWEDINAHEHSQGTSQMTRGLDRSMFGPGGPGGLLRRGPRRWPGFTLVELLIVLVIVALLASAAFTAVRSARREAQRAVRQEGLQQLGAALELYHAEHDTWPASLTEVVADPSRRDDQFAVLPAIPACPDGKFEYDGNGHVWVVEAPSAQQTSQHPSPEQPSQRAERPTHIPRRPQFAALVANAIANLSVCVLVIRAVLSTLTACILTKLSKPLWLGLLEGQIRNFNAAVYKMKGKTLLWFALGEQGLRSLTAFLIIHMNAQCPNLTMPLRHKERPKAARKLARFWKQVSADPEWNAPYHSIEQFADRSTLCIRLLLSAAGAFLAIHAFSLPSQSLTSHCFSVLLLLLSVASLVWLFRALPRQS